ncbi:hypothetical protein IKO70_05165, partial [bacterium]|nr:hypothetical protein [bacterium]
MKKLMNFLLVFLMISGLFSCSSSHSSTDSDVLPDSDDSETITDDDSDSQESEIIDDSDADSDVENPEQPDDGIFEETEPINGYARCYDKIPAGDYEGFFADPNIESQIKKSLGYEE